MTEKELELHREMVYAIGLVKVLRKYLEDMDLNNVSVVAQVDAVNDKLVSIDKMLDG